MISNSKKIGKKPTGRHKETGTKQKEVYGNSCERLLHIILQCNYGVVIHFLGKLKRFKPSSKLSVQLAVLKSDGKSARTVFHIHSGPAAGRTSQKEYAIGNGNLSNADLRIWKL